MSTEAAIIHPDCPAKLRRIYREADYNQRAVAKRLKINSYYVNRAIRHGERPANKAIARAMGFPREYRRRGQSAEPKPEPPIYVKWWRALDKATREQWVRSCYHAASDTTD